MEHLATVERLATPSFPLPRMRSPPLIRQPSSRPMFNRSTPSHRCFTTALLHARGDVRRGRAMRRGYAGHRAGNRCASPSQALRAAARQRPRQATVRVAAELGPSGAASCGGLGIPAPRRKRRSGPGDPVQRPLHAARLRQGRFGHAEGPSDQREAQGRGQGRRAIGHNLSLPPAGGRGQVPLALASGQGSRRHGEERGAAPSVPHPHGRSSLDPHLGSVGLDVATGRGRDGRRPAGSDARGPALPRGSRLCGFR